MLFAMHAQQDMLCTPMLIHEILQLPYPRALQRSSFTIVTQLPDSFVLGLILRNCRQQPIHLQSHSETSCFHCA